MHLKDLTLRGFKTFADKTSFVFESPPSITAIVGPNGCGKSNIIDSLRFVIGEQSIKELRGQSLEEVIFAGSTGRKSTSLAEVSILLDNCDGRLKTDYTEVLIKRRVFRSGESEFYINKNLCRLKDIKELFLDTGIGDGAYSIINQGQVDSLLSSKPEDRRAVFEEAAQIGKYKFRKRAAERRLIGTEQNLLRVNDLRGEIKENIRVLEVQAAKASEYKEMSGRLGALEIGLARKQLKSLNDKRALLLQKVEELKDKTHHAESGASTDEEERSKIKDLIRSLEEKIESARQKITAYRTAFEEEKRKASVGKERLSGLCERLEQAKKEEERTGTALKTKSEKINEKIDDVKNYQDGFNNTKQLIENARNALDDINKRIEESIRGWNNLKNPIFEREMDISSKKHTIAEIELSLKFAAEACEQEKAFLDNLKGLKDDMALLETEVFALEGVSAQLKERIASRKSEIDQKIDIETRILAKNIEEKSNLIKQMEENRSKELESLSLIEKNASEMNDRFSQLEKKMNELTSQKEKAIENLASSRAAFSNFDETFKSKQKDVDIAREELVEIEGETINKRHEIGSLEARIETVKKEIEDSERSQPQILESEKQLGSTLQELLNSRVVKQARLDELEEKLKTLTGEERNIRDALSKEEISLVKIEAEISSIENIMREEYQMAAGDVLSSDVAEVSNILKAKEEIDEIKRSVRDLGPVNLLAMDEFEAAKERISFIETQYNDLVSARDNLNSLIKDLENEAKQRFVKTIADVNGHFGEIFGQLFEGGEARIELSEGDPLEAGVEIIAKPSGKRWLNLSLMSGGEKALTAISIIFALMKTNPSPFCFMDEVDAALDEINIMRFTKLLKAFSKNMQIMIVTHSKRTMSVVNTMYGITMEEPGISKLVSMKLVKAAD